MHELPTNTKELLEYLRSLKIKNPQEVLSLYTRSLSILQDDIHSLYVFLDYINIASKFSEVEEIEHMYTLFKIKLRKFRIFWINFIDFQVKRRRKDFDLAFLKVLEYLKFKVFEGKDELYESLLGEKETIRAEILQKERSYGEQMEFSKLKSEIQVKMNIPRTHTDTHLDNLDEPKAIYENTDKTCSSFADFLLGHNTSVNTKVDEAEKNKKINADANNLTSTELNQIASQSNSNMEGLTSDRYLKNNSYYSFRNKIEGHSYVGDTENLNNFVSTKDFSDKILPSDYSEKPITHKIKKDKVGYIRNMKYSDCRSDITLQNKNNFYDIDKDRFGAKNLEDLNIHSTAQQSQSQINSKVDKYIAHVSAERCGSESFLSEYENKIINSQEDISYTETVLEKSEFSDTLLPIDEDIVVSTPVVKKELAFSLENYKKLSQSAKDQAEESVLPKSHFLSTDNISTSNSLSNKSRKINEIMDLEVEKSNSKGNEKSNYDKSENITKTCESISSTFSFNESPKKPFHTGENSVPDNLNEYAISVMDYLSQDIPYISKSALNSGSLHHASIGGKFDTTETNLTCKGNSGLRKDDFFAKSKPHKLDAVTQNCSQNDTGFSQPNSKGADLHFTIKSQPLLDDFVTPTSRTRDCQKIASASGNTSKTVECEFRKYQSNPDLDNHNIFADARAYGECPETNKVGDKRAECVTNCTYNSSTINKRLENSPSANDISESPRIEKYKTGCYEKEARDQNRINNIFTERIYNDKNLVKNTILESDVKNGHSVDFVSHMGLSKDDMQKIFEPSYKLRFSPNKQVPFRPEVTSKRGFIDICSSHNSEQLQYPYIRQPTFKNDFGLTRIPFKDKELLVISKIGKGGYSNVYRVILNNEIYALKQIRVDDQESLNICIDEINLLKKLSGCEYVIKLIDYEIKSDVVNIILEYGESDLMKIIKTNNLDIFYIKYLFGLILKILIFIHSQKIVHRDIKPANFVLVKGRLKIIDFGISKSIKGDTTSIIDYEKAGTLNFISPEQCCNGRIGRATDIWAAGCILYLMIYKRNIHNSKSVMDVIRMMTDEVEIKYDPADSEAIDVMKACLNYDAKKRLKPEEILNMPFFK